MSGPGELPFPYEYNHEHKGPRVPGTAPRERADASLRVFPPRKRNSRAKSPSVRCCRRFTLLANADLVPFCFDTVVKHLISKMRGSNFVHQFQRKIEDLRAAQKADLSTARAVEGVLRLDVLKAAPQNLVRARNEGKTLLDRDVQYRRRELAEAWQRIDKRIDGVVRDLRLVRPQLHGTFDPKTVFTRLWGLVHWFFVQPYDLACQADLATRWFEWQSLFAPHIQNQKPETLAEIWGVLPSALEAYVTTLPETRRRMQDALDAARKAKEAVQQSLARGAMGYRAALRYRGIGY